MLGFQPVSEAYSLSEKVFDQVRDAISAGRYSPGDKLPSENELVNVFKVSRTSVREAMKMLAGQGLITVKRGLGAYVADYREPSRLSNLQTILSPHTENILELFQIRKFLSQKPPLGPLKRRDPLIWKKWSGC
jgi:GntR family transcriptional repressor for pyruvate dehydrogenase complex